MEEKFIKLKIKKKLFKIIAISFAAIFAMVMIVVIAIAAADKGTDKNPGTTTKNLRSPEIVEEGLGNITGNLRNYGFVIDGEKSIYYLGFNNGEPSGIYKAGKDGENKEKLTSKYGLCMNIEDGYIYFIDTDMEGYQFNISKIKTDGKDEKTIIQDIDQLPIQVKDGWIYFSKDYRFYRIRTNGEDLEKLSNKEIETYQIVDEWIYYTFYDYESGKYTISKMQLDGSEGEKIDSDAGKDFYLKGPTIYYIMENYDSDSYNYSYGLYKINTNGKNKEKIVDMDEDIDISYINMGEDGIYYVADDDDYDTAIYYIKYDGKGKIKIVDLEDETPIIVGENSIFYTDTDYDYSMRLYKIDKNGKHKTELK